MRSKSGGMNAAGMTVTLIGAVAFIGFVCFAVQQP
jgi:flagellar biogenesis protein FliO